MKTKSPNDSELQRPETPFSGRPRIPQTACVALLAGLMLASLSVRAGNLLVNPGFEASPFTSAWSTHTTETWSMNGANTAGKLYRTGANALWTQGLYLNGGPPTYYNMYAYQKLAAAPGSTYTADAWFSEYTFYYQAQGGGLGNSGLLTSDASGVEDCWVEVQFLSISNSILADYKSAIISPIDVTLPGSAGVQTINVNNWPTVTNIIDISPGVTTNVIYLQWIHCQVTNQFDVSTIGPNTDPATETVNTTLGGSGVMTAPPGTAYVQYMLCLAQAQYESGANYWDDCTLIQLGGPSPSVISGLSPNGSKFFNTNSSLTFSVTSASTGGAALPTNPTSGISVILNGIDKSANLQFSGTPTNWNVTLPGLASNALYTVSISVSNSAGLITTASASFDTLNPVLIVPAETFDYNGGQFIQNPIPTSTLDPNSYFGRAGMLGVDMSTYNGGGVLPTGASTLAPNYPNRTDLNEAFQAATDAQLPLYTAQSNSAVYNVNFSYNNGGNWFNYTRNPWPSGNYEVYARISGGGGAGSEFLNILTGGYGTATQVTNNLGRFYLANGVDWTHYYWVPLMDTDGNLVPVNVPSGQQTLQLSSGGGENVISFVFVPFPASGVPPSISNINPVDGTAFVPASAGLTFTVTAGQGTTVNNSGVHLSLNGADVTSGLSFSGSGPINVSYLNLRTNNFYTAVIAVTNTAGSGTSRIITFDTMSTGNFYFKADDFDHDDGQWDVAGNGLVPNAYLGQGGTDGVDYHHTTVTGELFTYRFGLPTEVTSDIPLPGFTASANYDVGWFGGGDWGNFTRNYPAGKYYLYGRLAGMAGSVSLSRVTAGWGTANQTLQALGTCNSSVTSQGWQTWTWCPLQKNGLPTLLDVGGTNTLRVTSAGNVNADYFMLVPAQGIKLSAAKSGTNVVVSFPTQPGISYRVFAVSNLTSGAWSALATVPGDGTTKSVSDPANAATHYYKVTSP
jgi:hypothetical protein